MLLRDSWFHQTRVVGQFSSTTHDFPLVEWVLSLIRDLLVAVNVCKPLLYLQCYHSRLWFVMAHSHSLLVLSFGTCMVSFGTMKANLQGRGFQNCYGSDVSGPASEMHKGLRDNPQEYLLRNNQGQQHQSVVFAEYLGQPDQQLKKK